ncbi:MAG: histidine phosphatase family protein [Oscillospiraceae bacterium]|nr:histidine phosphatase family protein [Oscillospiraceae bacterium]
MKSYTVHLIRNGLTDENLEGRYIGHTDVELSEEGKAQLGQMKDELIFPPVDAVFTSPLKRCTETAKILYPDNMPIVIDGFIEYNFGEFENKTADELKESPVFPRWLAGERGVEPPFGESNEAFEKRIRETFEKVAEGLMKTGTTSAAIVTHGGVIMAILAAYGIPELPMHEWLTPSGCGFTIKINPSLWMRAKKFEVFSDFPYEREELPD